MSVDPQTPGFPDHAKPAPSLKPERKTALGTLAFYLAGVGGLAVINGITGNDNELLIWALPDWLEAFVLPVVPAAVGFATGWITRHTPRPDLEG